LPGSFREAPRCLCGQGALPLFAELTVGHQPVLTRFHDEDLLVREHYSDRAYSVDDRERPGISPSCCSARERAPAWGPVNTRPQAAQKRAPSGDSAPHEGQTTDIEAQEAAAVKKLTTRAGATADRETGLQKSGRHFPRENARNSSPASAVAPTFAMERALSEGATVCPFEWVSRASFGQAQPSGPVATRVLRFCYNVGAPPKGVGKERGAPIPAPKEACAQLLIRVGVFGPSVLDARWTSS
jgi:hypothetical protein